MTRKAMRRKAGKAPRCNCCPVHGEQQEPDLQIRLRPRWFVGARHWTGNRRTRGDWLRYTVVGAEDANEALLSVVERIKQIAGRGRERIEITVEPIPPGRNFCDTTEVVLAPPGRA